MVPLTDYETKYYEKQKYCHICKEKFCTHENDEKFEKYRKVMDHIHYTGKFRGAAHNICNLRYKVQREIPAVICNGSTYDYHLIIKELAEEFKSDFNCLGENTEKYITFSVPIKKENKDGKTIIKLIDSFRFMNISLVKLTDNLSEINNKDCKKCMERNKTKSECQYIKHKKNKLIYKCKKGDDISYKPVNGLITKFPSTYKFVLLSRKGVYSYEYLHN